MGLLDVMLRFSGGSAAVAFALWRYWLYRIRIAHKPSSGPLCLCLLLFDAYRASLPVVLLLCFEDVRVCSKTATYSECA